MPTPPAPSPEQVAAALAACPAGFLPALPGRTNHLAAGILVPLQWREGRLLAVLTLRSSHLRRHPGEVSWPGGGPAPDDRDLLATALREAREEIGALQARVLGRLSSVPLYTSDWRLEPWVAEVGAVRADGDEVVRLVPLDLFDLLSARFIHAVAYTLWGQDHLSPVWELPPDLLEGLDLARTPVVYGGTAHVLLELLERLAPLFDLEVPPRRVGQFAVEDLIPGFRPMR